MHIKISIDNAVKKLDVAHYLAKNKSHTDFWHQCIRDKDGEWLRYTQLRSLENTRYFYGHQPYINYTNQKEVDLLRTNLKIRYEIYKSLDKIMLMDVRAFKEWLIHLRQMMEYRPTEDWKLDVHATTTHTEVVTHDVLSIARKYNDPYDSIIHVGPIFRNFPKAALPIDEMENDLVKHTYPDLKFSKLYLEAVLEQFKGLFNDNHDRQTYIKGIAYLYQLLINLHYFPSINTSLYMNISNALLEVADMKGVEHGIKDFVAMRLQPENYQSFFYHEVMRRNS